MLVFTGRDVQGTYTRIARFVTGAGACYDGNTNNNAGTFMAANGDPMACANLCLADAANSNPCK